MTTLPEVSPRDYHSTLTLDRGNLFSPDSWLSKSALWELNERSLYQLQWGFRKQGRRIEDFLDWAKVELRPVMRRMLALCHRFE